LTTASRLSAFWIGPIWAAATLTIRISDFLGMSWAQLQFQSRAGARSITQHRPDFPAGACRSA
jgi:hypothetical protein